MKLAILLVVLAHAADARAECDNMWRYTDVVGAATDGSYVTRTRSYASTGKLEDKNMNETIALLAADGTQHGSFGRCVGHGGLAQFDDPSCPKPGAKPFWTTTGDVPAELIADDPKPDALVKTLAQRLKLRPLERFAKPVTVSWAFVRVGGALVKLIPEREVVSNIDNRPFVWKARVFERPGQDSVFLELATSHSYGAYGGSCGETVRTIEIVPRARLDAKRSSFAIDTCLAAEKYEPEPGLSRGGPLACLVDLGDARGFAAMPGLGDDPYAAPRAAADLAAKTNEKPLVELAKGTEPKPRTFAFRALTYLVDDVVKKQPARRKRVGLAAAPICLAAIPTASDELLDAARSCFQSTHEWLGTREILETLAIAHDETALSDVLRDRKDREKICAAASTQRLRDACDLFK
jgi:hypothetical protein